MNQTVNAEYANQISRVKLLTEILSQSCSSSKLHSSADSITVQFFRDGNQLCEYSYVEGRGVKIGVSENCENVVRFALAAFISFDGWGDAVTKALAKREYTTY